MVDIFAYYSSLDWHLWSFRVNGMSVQALLAFLVAIKNFLLSCLEPFSSFNSTVCFLIQFDKAFIYIHFKILDHIHDCYLKPLSHASVILSSLASTTVELLGYSGELLSCLFLIVVLSWCLGIWNGMIKVILGVYTLPMFLW